MGSYIAYIAGGALATSFASNNRFLAAVSWLAIGALIVTMYVEYM